VTPRFPDRRHCCLGHFAIRATPRRRVLAGGAWLALTAFAGGCANATDPPMLQGSGATFPAPLYKRWFLDYYRQSEDSRVNYTPIGSGAGIRQFSAGLVQFGASDAGISDKEIAKLPPRFGGVLAVPMTAGCIVLAYNLPGLRQPIRLSRAAYVDIFRRQITRWNDERITRDNPMVALPDQPITVVARADSSGTTFAFTSHMAAVANVLELPWEPGVDKSVRFVESISAQGNDGVAALIQLTTGAIGYIEYGYAHLSGLPMAALENRAGHFVSADERGEAGLAALRGAAIPEDLQIRVPDPPAPEAYPIVTYTWLLTRKRYDNAADAARLEALLRFCLERRQQETAAALGYLRVPDEVIERALSEIHTLEAGS
jgi:phosphate transport system substrate-binding protein